MDGQSATTVVKGNTASVKDQNQVARNEKRIRTRNHALHPVVELFRAATEDETVRVHDFIARYLLAEHAVVQRSQVARSGRHSLDLLIVRDARPNESRRFRVLLRHDVVAMRKGDPVEAINVCNCLRLFTADTDNDPITGARDALLKVEVVLGLKTKMRGLARDAHGVADAECGLVWIAEKHHTAPRLLAPMRAPDGTGAPAIRAVRIAAGVRS